MLSSETNTVLHNDAGLAISLLVAPSETLSTFTAERQGPDLGSALVLMAMAILMYWLVPIFLLMVILPDGSA
jgi:hypothetical protein